jgi:hypothetical protein
MAGYTQRSYRGLSAGAVQHLENWRSKMAEITMYPVDSSNVEAFGYDAEEQILAVRFLAKGNNASTLYHYYEVEPQVYEEFMNAPSKGKFIWSHLRDKYDYERVE